jgi:large subunit ribosomal protein L10
MTEKQEKTDKTKTHVPRGKIEAVKRIAEEMKKAKTVMIVSIKSLPANQLQKMKKDLRGKAKMEVAKKSILQRAIEAAGIGEMMKLSEHVKEDYALLISDDDAFELSAWFTDNKNPIAAKEGQIAENDIIVEEGPTDLVPGPVISELGALGLQIMVEDGKITIRKSKVAVKKGDKVNSSAASIFQKLGIKPFMIGISPVAFYDSSSKKIYVDIKIDKKKMLENLISAKARAVGFAINLAYASKDTIGMLLAKANAQMNALSKLGNKT